MNLEHPAVPKSKAVLRVVGAYGENMKTRWQGPPDQCGSTGAPTSISNDNRGLESVKESRNP